MKVSDIMQRSVISVSKDAPLREVGRLIFSLGIAGIPVLRGKKLVGIVTEHDILSRMYPDMQDVIEDYAHARDFEAMEKNLVGLLDAPVLEVMSEKVTTVTPQTSLMEAQSTMLVHKVGRLPVVDTNNNLLGIISQGDIFRALLKKEIPRLEKERYAGFIGRHYDIMVDWEKRFNFEFPSIIELFKKEKVKSILDVGVWTGEYTIGLAKKYKSEILGLDHNPIMIKMAQDKKDKLPSSLKERIAFKLTDFSNLSSKLNNEFDAAICMGNSLPYIPVTPQELFSGIFNLLRDKNGLLVMQILNLEKVLQRENRLLDFGIQKSHLAYEKEHLFLEFFDKKGSNWLSHHVVIFDSDGENWTFKGITTVPVRNITKDDIEKALKKAGFKTVQFSGTTGEYQGEYGKLSFDRPFDRLNSDFINVIAKR